MKFDCFRAIKKDHPEGWSIKQFSVLSHYVVHRIPAHIELLSNRFIADAVGFYALEDAPVTGLAYLSVDHVDHFGNVHSHPLLPAYCSGGFNASVVCLTVE